MSRQRGRAETNGQYPKPRLTLDELRSRLVVDVEEGGAHVGLKRSAAYAAAKAGQLPTVRFGRRLMVPVPKLLALLGVDGPVTESNGRHDTSKPSS
jgi:hypothetical protein